MDWDKIHALGKGVGNKIDINKYLDITMTSVRAHIKLIVHAIKRETKMSKDDGWEFLVKAWEENNKSDLFISKNAFYELWEEPLYV